MIRTRLFAFSLLLSLAATMAVAQTPVGRAVVEGRTVTLFDNQTWSFDTEVSTSSDCQPVDAIVLFCDAGPWQSLARQQEFDALFTKDSVFYGGLIVERFGSDQGLSYELLRTAAISNAAAATGTQPEQIPVLDSFEEVTDVLEYKVLVYTAEVAGTPFVFANAAFLRETFSGQALVWTFGTEFSDEHRAQLTDFIGRVSLREQAE